MGVLGLLGPGINPFLLKWLERIAFVLSLAVFALVVLALISMCAGCAFHLHLFEQHQHGTPPEVPILETPGYEIPQRQEDDDWLGRLRADTDCLVPAVD